MATARINYARRTRLAITAEGALRRTTPSAGASAETRALRGLRAQTVRVILAGRRAREWITADKGAMTVSLCQRPLWWAGATFAHTMVALLACCAAIGAAATVPFASL
jgi:hypothetical protein